MITKQMSAPRFCCVSGCQNTRYSLNRFEQDPTKSELYFMNVPKTNPDLFRKWKEAIPRQPDNPLLYGSNYIICSDHFSPEDFSIRSKVLTTESGKSETKVTKLLKSGRCPSIFDCSITESAEPAVESAEQYIYEVVSVDDIKLPSNSSLCDTNTFKSHEKLMKSDDLAAADISESNSESGKSPSSVSPIPNKIQPTIIRRSSAVSAANTTNKTTNSMSASSSIDDDSSNTGAAAAAMSRETRSSSKLVAPIILRASNAAKKVIEMSKDIFPMWNVDVKKGGPPRGRPRRVLSETNASKQQMSPKRRNASKISPSVDVENCLIDESSNDEEYEEDLSDISRYSVDEDEGDDDDNDLECSVTDECSSSDDETMIKELSSYSPSKTTSLKELRPRKAITRSDSAAGEMVAKALSSTANNVVETVEKEPSSSNSVFHTERNIIKEVLRPASRTGRNGSSNSASSKMTTTTTPVARKFIWNCDDTKTSSYRNNTIVLRNNDNSNNNSNSTAGIIDDNYSSTEMDNTTRKVKIIPPENVPIKYEKLWTLDYINWVVRKEVDITSFINIDERTDIIKKIKFNKDLKIEVHIGLVLVNIEKFTEVALIKDLNRLLEIVEEMPVCENSTVRDNPFRCMGFRTRVSARLCSNCAHGAASQRQALKRKAARDLRREENVKKDKPDKEVAQELRKEVAEQKKTITQLRTVIEHLEKKCVSKEYDLQENMRRLPPTYQENIKACLNSYQAKKSHGIRYTKAWLDHCVLMKRSNVSAFNWLRKQNIVALPCETTISNRTKKLLYQHGSEEAMFLALAANGLPNEPESDSEDESPNKVGFTANPSPPADNFKEITDPLDCNDNKNSVENVMNDISDINFIDHIDNFQ